MSRTEIAAKPAATKRKRKTSADPQARITRDLADRIGPRKYDKWFGQAIVHVKGRTVRVGASSRFVANWIGAHFVDDLTQAAKAELGAKATVDVFVRESQTEETAAPTKKPTRSRAKTTSDRSAPQRGKDQRRSDDRPDTGRQPVFRKLADFIVGPSNQLAHATAGQLAGDVESSPISPLFIWGECGVGKTHLLQGICECYVLGTGRSERVRYMTGEQFTNEFIAAVKRNTIDAFRRRTRKLDLLVIDDVHFLANKMRTQSEFLHTLDAIDLSGAKVVLSSDAHPRQIRSFRQALISRFMSGMVVQVQRPERETRRDLIEAFSKRRGLRINEAATDLIASHCVGSVRELEGTITKVAALHSLTSTGDGSEEVGLVLARQLFEHHGWQPSSPVRMATITEVVCNRLGVARADLLGSRRHRRVVLARALVAHLGRELTTHSYPEIAQSLGRTYHSTVHTAAQRLRRQLDEDEASQLGSGEVPVRLRELVDQLRHEIIKTPSAG